jgi:Deoxyribonuclease NucA/NucB
MPRALISVLACLSVVFATSDALAGKPKNQTKTTTAAPTTTKKTAGSIQKPSQKKSKVTTVEISKSKYPESAKHITDAQEAGHPKVVTIDRGGAKANRKASLKGIATKKGKDRDEYPPAMFKDGGKGASVRHIDPSDNRGSGSCIGAQCRGLKDGTKVKLKVVK